MLVSHRLHPLAPPFHLSLIPLQPAQDRELEQIRDSAKASATPRGGDVRPAWQTSGGGGGGGGSSSSSSSSSSGFGFGFGGGFERSTSSVSEDSGGARRVVDNRPAWVTEAEATAQQQPQQPQQPTSWDGQDEALTRQASYDEWVIKTGVRRCVLRGGGLLCGGRGGGEGGGRVGGGGWR